MLDSAWLTMPDGNGWNATGAESIRSHTKGGGRRLHIRHGDNGGIGHTDLDESSCWLLTSTDTPSTGLTRDAVPAC